VLRRIQMSFICTHTFADALHHRDANVRIFSRMMHTHAQLRVRLSAQFELEKTISRGHFANEGSLRTMHPL
jgi:hypothetical protein